MITAALVFAAFVAVVTIGDGAVQDNGFEQICGIISLVLCTVAMCKLYF